MNVLIPKDHRLPQGLGAALPIPLNTQRNVDFPALERILQRLGDAGVDFIRLVNSEIGVRDGDAYIGMVSYVREILPKSTRIMESLPSTETRDVVRYCEIRSKHSGLPEPDGWMARPPLSRDVSVAGIIGHLRSVAESTDKPIVAVLTGLTLAGSARRQLIQALGEHPNIPAVLLSGSQALAWPTHHGLRLWVSGDTAILPMFAMGCDAVISQLAVAFPKKLKKIAETANFGAWSESRTELAPLFHLMQHVEELPSPAGIKSVLAHLSLCEDHLRLPHTPIATAEKDALYVDLAKLEYDQAVTEPL